MPSTVALDIPTTALLVMDYQNGIVEGYAADRDALLARTAHFIAAARRASIRVIYVVVGFRAGYPEANRDNPIFGAIRESGRFAAGDPTAEIHPTVAPAPDEVVITKHRVGAFLGTDLDMVLRANGIRTLVLTGIATSGVVLSTLRYAADADYRIVVVEDCCADRDAEVHRVLMEKVFPRQATIIRAEEAIAAVA